MARLTAAPARICAGAELSDGGRGVRFEVNCHGVTLAAFAIRHRGRVHGYLNRCAHRQVELDWEPGEFFDAGRRYLVCATHGAVYEPDSGACVGGPCAGAGLTPLPLEESRGEVVLAAADGIHLAASI